MLMNVATAVVVVKTKGNEVFIVRQYNEQMTRYTNLSESRCSSRLSVLSGRKR